MINNNNNGNNENNKNSNSNWLGFSLTPHMNTNTTTSTMESSPPQSSFNLPPHFNYSNIYGVEGENAENGIYSAFPIMPLKSDGSLCLMEAITRSQSQGLFFLF